MADRPKTILVVYIHGFQVRPPSIHHPLAKQKDQALPIASFT